MLLNRVRATDYLRSCGLDALVATSPVNVTYLSDFRCWLAPLSREYMVVPGASSRLILQNFALFAVDGAAALVVEPYFAADASGSWIEDVWIGGDASFDKGSAETVPERLRKALELVRASAAASPLHALVAALKDRGLGNGRLGVEFDGLAAEVGEELRKQLPCAQLFDCSNLLRLIRAVKSPDEVERLERAATAAELAAQAAFATAEPGRTLGELEGVYRARLGELSMDFDHFAFGPRGLGITSHTEYTLEAGDVLYADWGCLYGGYCSDTGTTLAVSKLDARFAERFEATVAAVQAGAAVARPGLRASEVQAVMREAMEQAGETACYPHGHGFGLEVRDYPILVPPTGYPIRDECLAVSSDLPLEVGMVFNLEAPIFELGRGSVHTECSFVVTTDGCRPLVRQDRAAPVVSDGAGKARR